MTLRPYQLDSLAKARAAIEGGAQSVLIVQPTGCGKTRTAVSACVNHVKLGGIPMFVAPRRELVQQASGALFAEGLEPGHDVFVRTIQELSVANAKIPKCTMVVLDEARHYVAEAWSRLRAKLPDAIYLGLDATPERGDGKGLGSMFDVLIEAISVRDAIDADFLVPCDVKRPERALGPRELAQDPVDAYLAQCTPEVQPRGVLFAPSVELAKEYAATFFDRGVPAVAVYADMATSLRDAALESYAQGKTRVLTNVQILTEGWDSPSTEIVMLARHFGTAGGMLQACGRGLRLSPETGKKKCLLLDLVGATHVHGEVDDVREWQLHGKAITRASEPDVRFCPVCGNIVDGPTCAECGHDGQMKKRKPRVLGLPIDRFPREHAMSDEQAAKALRGLINAARVKGYQQGWAFRIFEHKYGRKVTSELKRLANQAYG